MDKTKHAPRSQLIVNARGTQWRIALCEGGEAREFVVAPRREDSLLGNIYCGRVQRVMPSMQAAFVDIGEQKNGFLFVADAVHDDAPYATEGRDNDGAQDAVAAVMRTAERGSSFHVGNVLKVGDTVCVQVQREPMGTKGARLTCHIGIPGHYLVHVPLSQHVGISRRIGSEARGEHLRALLGSFAAGWIARTAAEDVDDESLRAEAAGLQDAWSLIEARRAHAAVPELLHRGDDILMRCVRDMLVGRAADIHVDVAAVHDSLRSLCLQDPALSAVEVHFHDDALPIFARWDLERNWQKLLHRRVWLHSGAYIVIDPTEALTAIDVNSGRFVQGDNIEAASVKINVEAAREIARQVRLRNIGGIIVIDFIDMVRDENRTAVYEALQESLAGDRMRTELFPMTELGLLQMTRRRLRPSVAQTVGRVCDHCAGTGMTAHEATQAHDVCGQLASQYAQHRGSKGVEIWAHKEIRRLLCSSQDWLCDVLPGWDGEVSWHQTDGEAKIVWHT